MDEKTNIIKMVIFLKTQENLNQINLWLIYLVRTVPCGFHTFIWIHQNRENVSCNNSTDFY